MQPNGPTPPIQPVNDPYGYILNQQTPQKKPFLFGSGKPSPLIMALFVLFVLLIVGVAFAVYSSLTAKNWDSVIALAARQEEIIRVAELGQKKANDPATLIYVATLKNVTQSEQNDTIAFLKKKGVKAKDMGLSAQKDSSTDKALDTAEQNNTYDKVLLTKLGDEVSDYQKAQKQVSVTDNSKSEKTLLATLAANAKTISSAE